MEIEEIHIPGMPVPVERKGNVVQWKMLPIEDEPTHVLKVLDSMYGRFPRIGIRLTSETWQTPDTATVVGYLSQEARTVFRTVLRSTFRAHEPDGGAYFTAPTEAQGCLSALYAILATSRANIPPELVDVLWPLTRVAVRTGSCIIEPGEGGRKVEQTGKGKRAAPDIWHVHNESTRKPDFEQEMHIPEDSFVVASSLPTIMADSSSLVEGKRAFKSPHAINQYEVALFTDDTWHTSQKNATGQPIERHFMRVFNRVPWQTLKKIMSGQPKLMGILKKYLRNEAPDSLHISDLLQS